MWNCTEIDDNIWREVVFKCSQSEINWVLCCQNHIMQLPCVPKSVSSALIKQDLQKNSNTIDTVVVNSWVNIIYGIKLLFFHFSVGQHDQG